MKTYNLFYAFFACAIISCSKSDPNPNPDSVPVEESDTVNYDAANYNLIVNNDGVLSSTLINASAEILTINSAKSAFKNMSEPDLTYNDASVFTAYHKNTNCSGTISQFNFSNNTLKEVDLFADLTDCNLKATAIAHSNTKFYLTYHLDDSDDYFVRVIDSSKSESNFIDVPLKSESYDPTYIPKELVFANDKLFILGHDEDATDEYHLLVMNSTTNKLVSDLNLGFDVKQIFKNPTENIIVSYTGLHTEVNSSTLKLKYTSYSDSGNAPNFTNSKYNYFDKDGRMYYKMQPGEYSSYVEIPAVYDFKTQLAVLYAYENFLSEAQRKFQFEIENTTIVSYDEKNNFILIGYKKMESSKGGLLRIKPAPDPEFIDDLDVDGVPYKLYVK